MLKGFMNNIKPLDILTEGQVESIHRGAMEVLEDTGVRIEHEKALKLCKEYGCIVDFENQRVKLPTWLVEDSLRKCPSSYMIKARDPQNDVRIGGNTMYFLQGMGMRYVDVDTWETRSATLQEHKETMIVADFLKNTHIADAYEFYMDLEGVPPIMTFLEGLVSGIRNSSLAEHFGYQKDCEIFAIQMAQELGITLDAELDIASPLTFYGESVEAIYRFAEAGMGVWACSGAHLGTSAPATIAGGIVMQHAETAAFITLSQMIKPGTPVIIEPAGMVMHPKKGHLLAAPPQFALVQAGLFQIYRKWGVPLCSVHGYVTDSKMYDYQCGFEKALGTLLSALTGSNVHIFQGGNTMELTFSNVLQVLDDDIAGWVGHFLEGFTVSDETLAVDVIKSVGPIPGNFLGAAHTMKWWMKERFDPFISDQDSYEEWIKKGKVDIVTRAKQKIQEILETHKPTPLTGKQEQIIEDVMNEARTYYKKKGMISDAEWSLYMKTLKSVY